MWDRLRSRIGVEVAKLWRPEDYHEEIVFLVLAFTFAPANSGYLLFQTTGLFDSGEQYYCATASLLNAPRAVGEDIVPVSIFDATYAHSSALAGNQIIASVPAAVPEPASALLMFTTLLGAAFGAR